MTIFSAFVEIFLSDREIMGMVRILAEKLNFLKGADYANMPLAISTILSASLFIAEIIFTHIATQLRAKMTKNLNCDGILIKTLGQKMSRVLRTR
ncbi:MAG: hypothetical protein M8357_15900 [Desulfobulbaceae bacterium]|nr:hypothetical protein [Desulfobulbaceae bacterium]